MSRSSLVRAGVVLGLGVSAVLGATAHAGPTFTKLYLHGSAASAHVDGVGGLTGLTRAPWMDRTAPTATTPKSAALGMLDPRLEKARDGVVLPAFAADVHGTVSQVTGSFNVVAKGGGGLGQPGAASLVVMLFRDGDPYPVATATAPFPDQAPVAVNVSFGDQSFFVDRQLYVEITTRNPAQGVGGTAVSRTTEGALLFDSVDAQSALSFTLARESGDAPPAQSEARFRTYPEPFVPSGPIEASVGVDPRDGSTFLFASEDVLRLRLDGGDVRWDDVTDQATNVVADDPILWVDPRTGRLFAMELLGFTSSLAYSDDDGATWHVAGPPLTVPALDHETLSGGPFHDPAPSSKSYPDALYYCAQGMVVAQCVRSDDGGTTWGAPVAAVGSECNTLHGHPVVDAQGNVYLPFKNCGGTVAVAISRDNGVTWTLRHVPGTTGATNDPTIAFDRAGTLYLGTNSGERARFSVSTDHGETWSPAVDVGASDGINNARFVMVAAGDPGRAALVFYGTTTAGDDQATAFTGVWYVHVAFTYDGGHTWSFTNATADNPVQRGPICSNDGGCSVGKNLIDFQGVTLDRDGSVVIGFSDGCNGQCNLPGGVHYEDDYLGVVAHQVGGAPLLLGAS